MVAFRFSLFLILNLLVVQSSSAQLLKREFSKREAKSIKRARIKESNLAFALVDLQTGKMLDSHNAHKLNILASVSKLFSTHFALKTLGPNFQFETKLGYTGKIAGEQLIGDLTLTGTGDPLFDSNDLFDFAKTIHARGINTIKGNIVVDESLFFKKKEVSNLGLGDQTYNPAIGPVAINFNRFILYRTSRRSKGKDVSFVPIPNLPHVNVINDKRKFPPAKRFDFDFILENKESWAINQKESYKRTEKVPIRKPGLFAGELLKSYLLQWGIVVQGNVISEKPELVQTLQTKKSVPLKEIVKLTLEYSNNLLAENTLLRAMKEVNKKNIPLIEAAGHVQKTITSDDDVVLINGSGLTSENKSTAKAMVNWLYRIHNEKFIDGSFFWSMLSLGGHNGWIRDRFMEPDMAHKIWGKTGSLDYVNNIAGFLNSTTGRWMAYAIFIFDEKKREVLDGIPNSKFLKLKKSAPRWKDRTSLVMEELLRGWHYSL